MLQPSVAIPFGPPAIPGVDGPVAQRFENVPARPFVLPSLQTRTVAELMAEQAAEDAAAPAPREPIYMHEFEFPGRRNLVQNPNAPLVSRWPPAPADHTPTAPSIPFVVSNLEGPDSTEAGFVPPLSMGDASSQRSLAPGW